MSALIDPQVIKQGDKPAFAVIPWDTYQELVRNYIPDESDVWFPQEVVEANVVRGDSLLKAWREHLGLTQAEVAGRAGMSQPAYAKLEKPDANPRTATLRKIARALGISLEQLTD
jgi:DNA-binding XRE family transcriptional regulator